MYNSKSKSCGVLNNIYVLENLIGEKTICNNECIIQRINLSVELYIKKNDE